MALTRKILSSILLVTGFAAAALGAGPLVAMAMMTAGLLIVPNREKMSIRRMSPAWLLWVAVLGAILLGFIAIAALNSSWAEALPETWLWWLFLLPLIVLFVWNVWRPEPGPAVSN